MKLLSSSDSNLGFYKEHPQWHIPVNVRFIPYHIGIFSVTGGGKSYLARYEVIPLLQKAGYNIIIFDWKGSDYVPYFDTKVNFSDIALDDDVVMSYLVSKMDSFGYSGEYRYRNSISDALEDVIYEGKWRQVETENLREFLESNVVGILAGENRDARGNITSFGQRFIRKFKKYLKKLKDEDFRNILGRMTPESILKLVREKHTVVLDISESGKDEKLSIFLSIAKYLQDLMEQKQILDIAVVIDEGPQYCPFKPVGIENDTTEIISQLCALGRSYHLSVVILSQGISGEIGINASIRRNLNTQFIGKIHPLDIYEAASLLSGLKLDPTFLVSLPEGHFYFLGSMNPSPIPLLISFNIDDSDTKK
jgi:DNA helicase HerA-like ATPase